jgi:CubicO group peptidase (beta-lactamase class C family)
MSDVCAYMAEQAAGLNVAGYAAAVVSGDKVTLAYGGEVRAGSGRFVKADTRFHICSCTKAFTALTFAGLIDQGMTDWDAPALTIVPEFQLADPWISRNLTFRDLAAMRVGLTREGVAEWGFRAESPMAQRLERARFMALEAPFRDRFSYSNLNYIALALATERISGQSFETCLDRAVLRPLKLERASLRGDQDDAEPHMFIQGSMTPVPELTGDSSQGSARVYLCAEDAARWIGAMLGASTRARSGEGRGSDQLFSCQSLMRSRVGGDLSAWGYGFGWMIARYQGRHVFTHSGGGRGSRAIIVLDPDQHAGVMLMLAHEGTAAEGLALALLELTAGRAPPTWTPPGPTPPTPATPETTPPFEGDPVGHYRGDVTGPVWISRSPEGHLRFEAEDAPAFNARLESIGDNRLRFDFDSPAMTVMPGDPQFQLSLHQGVSAGVWAASTYFGRLKRIDL